MRTWRTRGQAWGSVERGRHEPFLLMQGTVGKGAASVLLDWTRIRGGASHASSEKLKPPGPQSSPGEAGVLAVCWAPTQGLQSPALTHPPSSPGAFQLQQFSQDINGAGGKCRGRRIKVFPQINRRQKEKHVPVGTRPGAAHCRRPARCTARAGPFEG